MALNQEARGIWTYGLWLPYTLILISGRLVVGLGLVPVHALSMILSAITQWMGSVLILLNLVSSRIAKTRESLTPYIDTLLNLPR